MYLLKWIIFVMILYISLFQIIKLIIQRLMPALHSYMQYFGVWLHELSHMVFGLLTFHRIKGIKVKTNEYDHSIQGHCKLDPIGRDQRGLIDSIIVGLGPLLVGSIVILWSYLQITQATYWKDYLISIGVAYIALSAIIPSRVDIIDMFTNIFSSSFTLIRQIFCILMIIVLTVLIYPDLHFINKESLWPLYFIVFFYGAFLLDFLLLLLIRRISL